MSATAHEGVGNTGIVGVMADEDVRAKPKL